MESFDCILIPGGGLLPDGSLPSWTQARVDRALELSDQFRWIALLSGGTVHKPPPLDQDGYPIFESRAAASYLVEQGLEPTRILTEVSSYDTVGNAYFSRLLFAEPGLFSNLLVITSEFHLPRVQAAFNWIYNLTPKPIQYQIDYEDTPNNGLSTAGLKARVARENQSLLILEATSQEITSLREFHIWFYTKHAAYAVQSQLENLTGDILESY